MGTFIEELLKLKKEYQIACYNIRYINSEIKQIERVKKEAKGKVPAEFKKYYSTKGLDDSISALKRKRAFCEFRKNKCEMIFRSLQEIWNKKN